MRAARRRVSLCAVTVGLRVVAVQARYSCVVTLYVNGSARGELFYDGTTGAVDARASFGVDPIGMNASVKCRSRCPGQAGASGNEQFFVHVTPPEAAAVTLTTVFSDEGKTFSYDVTAIVVRGWIGALCVVLYGPWCVCVCCAQDVPPPCGLSIVCTAAESTTVDTVSVDGDRSTNVFLDSYELPDGAADGFKLKVRHAMSLALLLFFVPSSRRRRVSLCTRAMLLPF